MTTRTHLSPDQLLQSAIINELEWTPGVNPEQIGVAVNDGAVTLSGEVATLLEKDAAVRAAVRVRGVTALAAEIVVRDADGVINDADIARVARRVLSHHGQLEEQTVNATVEQRVVTLSGTVDWDYQRAAARRAVAVLPGVHEVIDRITVATPARVVDPRTRITETLSRTADIDAAKIEVEVHGTEVTLSGQVRCWSERQLVEQVAWAAPGVTHVHNNIVIAYTD